VHNKTKWKVNETYLERQWRPSERSSSWARGGREGSRKRKEKKEKQKQEVIPGEKRECFKFFNEG